MEYTYAQVLDGYKKSIESLKKLDNETYQNFQKLFKTFNKIAVEDFFKTLEIDINSPKRIPNSKSSISVSFINEEQEVVKVTMYYGMSCDIKIEESIKNENTIYNKYTLCPLMKNIENYIEGQGEIFFKKTSIFNGEHSKLYYAIIKNENELELIIQDPCHNIKNSIKQKEMPTGKEIV